MSAAVIVKTCVTLQPLVVVLQVTLVVTVLHTSASITALDTLATVGRLAVAGLQPSGPPLGTLLKAKVATVHV